jgi:anti-anti-sigma factor
MDLHIEHYLISEEIMVVKVVGELDVYSSPRLRDLVVELISVGQVQLIFDLSQLEFITSDGLGVLVGAFKRARVNAINGEGMVNLVVNSPRILKTFSNVRLTKIFAIFEDVASAVADMNADPSQRRTLSAQLVNDSDVGWHWFPARIYTSETDAGSMVEKCLPSVIDAFGMEVVYEFSIRRNSWFREFVLRMKDSTSLPTRDEQLSLLRRTLELQVLDRPQAQIDLAQSQALANLLISLEKTPNAIVQIGSVLLIKVRDTMIVRNLTQLEIAHWERNPGLFRDPAAALRELQRASDPCSAAEDPRQEDTSTNGDNLWPWRPSALTPEIVVELDPRVGTRLARQIRAWLYRTFDDLFHLAAVDVESSAMAH